MYEVNIFNEAGTEIIAKGKTDYLEGHFVYDIDSMAGITVHQEYQIQVNGGSRRGYMCTEIDVNAHTATFE